MVKMVHIKKVNLFRIPVKINISIPRLKCEFIGIDIQVSFLVHILCPLDFFNQCVLQDDQGRHEVGFVENTVKTPIGPEGEGCLFEAKFAVNKVPGNFHLSTHSVDVQPSEYDFAHEVT